MRRGGRPRVLDVILGVAVAVTAIAAMPRLAAGFGAGLQQIAAAIGSAVPDVGSQGTAPIELPSGGANASTGSAPIIDGLPEFTRDPQVQLSGRVPSFAVQKGRTLQVTVNGAAVWSGPIDANGGFKIPVAVKEGANAITVSLLAGSERIATSSASITLDRTPPQLTVLLPQPGSIVDGQSIAVQGKTESGANVSVNGHTVVVGGDGAFTDYLTAPPGSLLITVAAVDRAGNETKQEVEVVARPAAVAGPTLAIALDRATARPGQQVVATATLRDPLGPRGGTPVTVSVGVVIVGSAITDASGTARIGFAAPTTEGDIGVVVLGGGASGRTTLTVAR